MAKDFDAEIESIFSEREARRVKARREADQQTAAFEKSWAESRANVVIPALSAAVAALAQKGVKAHVVDLDHGVCLYIHENDERTGRG